LRATLLFERPFWREHLPAAWWMLDAFDGCCVYDEGARHDLGKWGALGFLIAGNAAMALANMDDERIEQLCLDALPPVLQRGRDLFVDRRIHRWMASVNAIPGGHPIRTRHVNHRPNPDLLPGVMVVGDFMFDATLNGALDSADAATDVYCRKFFVRRQAARRAPSIRRGPPPIAYKVRDRFWRSGSADMLDIAGLKPGATVLIAGSAGRQSAHCAISGSTPGVLESDPILHRLCRTSTCGNSISSAN
jgi:hypothetical protein